MVKRAGPLSSIRATSTSRERGRAALMAAGEVSKKYLSASKVEAGMGTRI
jgi:hypothetical protein